VSDFVLGNRPVGQDYRPLVIAEVGINHEGDVNKALQMVDAAADAGAEIIKFQCHITEKEMVPTDMKPGEISDERLWDIIKRCELTEAEEWRVMEHCAKRNLIYLSTPFSREAADRLEAMGVVGYKIGSGECNNIPLLRHIASFGKPMIVSTGMNGLDSVRRSVAAIRDVGAPVALMHCTSMYPTPYDKVRLGGIADLQAEFPDAAIGLSDHSLNIWTCLGAVALGASILEKHFTISRTWAGPDVPISIEPAELRALIEGSDAIWQARGGAKTVLPEEQPVIDFAYATVVTTAPVRRGEVFTRDNTWVKRPGTGAIPAANYESVLGLTATRDLPADVHVGREDIAGF